MYAIQIAKEELSRSEVIALNRIISTRTVVVHLENDLVKRVVRFSGKTATTMSGETVQIKRIKKILH